MWAQILRNLTPDALLNAIRASQDWMSVARGDPVQRRTVCLQLQAERRQRQDLLRNPGLGVNIHREETGQQSAAPKGCCERLQSGTDDFRWEPVSKKNWRWKN